jgi:dihydroneopterin aldolase/2-amino-4-hydroxy-6-hydroxymethyldihydropteridine diphosphokinase
MVVCYLGVGSNLGNRRKNIQLALEEINHLKDTKVIRTSRLIGTKPVGGPRQGDFLNGVVVVKTKLTPLRLLKKLKDVEKLLGRRKTVRFGPRIIDLDILLYGDKKVRHKNLIIPHPRMFERDFVIKPLLKVI